MDPIVPHADCAAHPIPLAVLEEPNARTVLVDEDFALIVDPLLRSVRAARWCPYHAEIRGFGPVNLLHLTPESLAATLRREYLYHWGSTGLIESYGPDAPLARLAASLSWPPPARPKADARATHAAVLAALKLDPEAFALALRARARPRPNVLTNEDYSRVWRHLHRYRQCAAEAPQLLRLLDMGIAAGVVDVRRPAGQSLREACRRLGLPTRAWHIFYRWPARFLEGALALAPKRRAFEVALSYVRFLVQAAIEVPPPARLLKVLARMVINLDREEFLFDAHLPQYWSLELIRLALEAGSRADRAGELERFTTEEFLPVLQWARDTEVDLVSAKPGVWPTYVRRARAWSREEQVRLAAQGNDWPFGSFAEKVAGLIAVPLRNAHDLLTEALAMRHCANHLEFACAQRGLRVFSLQDGTGRRLATVALGRQGGGYALQQVKGFANAEVAAPIRAAAQGLAQSCRAPAVPLAAVPMPSSAARGRVDGPVAPAPHPVQADVTAQQR